MAKKDAKPLGGVLGKALDTIKNMESPYVLGKVEFNNTDPLPEDVEAFLRSVAEARTGDYETSDWNLGCLKAEAQKLAEKYQVAYGGLKV
jgi:hypothetical protein